MKGKWLIQKGSNLNYILDLLHTSYFLICYRQKIKTEIWFNFCSYSK